jgi:5-methylcytosine-specific restriction protein B
MTKKEIENYLFAISKEHVFEAMQVLDNQEIPRIRQSDEYDVINEETGKGYPPPLLIEIAYKIASKKELPKGFFSNIGAKSPHFEFLIKLGFAIKKKNLASKKSLEDYLKEFSLIADDWFLNQPWLSKNYNYFETFFTNETLEKANWEDFQEMGNHIHAFNSLAIAKGNALGKPNLPIEDYKRIFNYLISKKDPINITINNLFKKYNGEYHLPFFGESTISELVAWAFSEKYVIYNARDTAALQFLGLKLDKIRGEKFGDKFLRYNEGLIDLRNKYEEIVGVRTETTLQLELDQFFSWLYETYISKSLSFIEIIEQLALQLEENEFVFKPVSANRYVQIGDSSQIIGGLKAHYEIIKRKKEIFVEIHFEDKNKSVFEEKIELESTDLEWFEWSGAKSIRYTGSVLVNDNNAVDILKERLIFLNAEIGDQVKTIIRSLSDEPIIPLIEIMTPPLNQILYGPPGTGKTYNTINKALNILEVDINYMKREDIIKLFKLKVQEGQIVFTTFHQSFSYEDFIEGIKPVIDSNESTIDGDLKYTVENGVMKDLVDRIDNAQQFVESNQKQIYIDPIKFSKNINKISLGNSLDSKDDIIYEYCMKNDCIVIGFGEDIDFSGVKNRIEIRKRFQDNGIETSTSMDFNISAIERLVLWMELGQLVFVSDGMSKLKAIGEVSGDYYCDPSSPIRYAQFRKVKWLYKDLALPIEEIYGKKFSQQTIYQIDPKQINQSFFSTKNQKKKGADKYVLIIDEINRGNISSIFGELITLIEPDKRKGAAEELSAILPYSKKPFSIPKNLYILGTMNTADRSVEALDTALRRRFSFEEMLPQPELLKDKGENGSGKVGGLVLEDLLITINERIEALVDRDHTIGHAFFMEVESLDSMRNVFANKVIPLLQEYFYGDYAKMEMVIGSDFFNIKDSSKIKFAVKPEDFETTGKTYQIKNLSDKTSMPDDVLITAFKNMIS